MAVETRNRSAAAADTVSDREESRDHAPRRGSRGWPSGHTWLALGVLGLVFALGMAVASLLWLFVRATSPSPGAAGEMGRERGETEQLRGTVTEVQRLRERIDQFEKRIEQITPGKQLEQMGKQLAEIQTQVGTRTNPAPAVAPLPSREYYPRDTLVCALNSRKLEYDRIVRPALVDLFVRPAESSQRFALAVALTNRTQTVVRMGERKKSEAELTSSLKAADHVSESPNEELAEELAAQFPDPMEPRQRRLILLASSDCPSPDQLPAGESKAKGWNRLREMQVRVDVVLVPATRSKAEDLSPELSERATGWLLFAARRQGLVHLLPRPAQAEAMTRLLRDRLLEMTAPTEKQPGGR